MSQSLSSSRSAVTPAPWTHRPGSHTSNDYVKGPDGELIAMVYAPYPSANARLIAAAPEVAEAAAEFLTWFETFIGKPTMSDIECFELTNLRAALAKAGL
jgi:hypothetical protein